MVGILLENAVSHSPTGSQVTLTPLVSDSELTLSITNSGSLRGSDTSSLFMPFQRGEGATSPGVGLGLYIARRVAESIGSTIDAHSVDGLVTFTFRFPIELVAGASTRVARASAARLDSGESGGIR